MARLTRRYFLGGLAGFTGLFAARVAEAQLIPFGMLKKQTAAAEAFPQCLSSQPLGYACLGGAPV